MFFMFVCAPPPPPPNNESLVHHFTVGQDARQRSHTGCAVVRCDLNRKQHVREKPQLQRQDAFLRQTFDDASASRISRGDGVHFWTALMYPASSGGVLMVVLYQGAAPQTSTRTTPRRAAQAQY